MSNFSISKLASAQHDLVINLSNLRNKMLVHVVMTCLPRNFWDFLVYDNTEVLEHPLIIDNKLILHFGDLHSIGVSTLVSNVVESKMKYEIVLDLIRQSEVVNLVCLGYLRLFSSAPADALEEILTLEPHPSLLQSDALRAVKNAVSIKLTSMVRRSGFKPDKFKGLIDKNKYVRLLSLVVLYHEYKGFPDFFTHDFVGDVKSNLKGKPLLERYFIDLLDHE